ncbi:MAG: radical SAM protein, partial [Spirochaetaceae bacterium]|nr:radical SAM protein [Spirochaetaceae bacterium]
MLKKLPFEIKIAKQVYWFYWEKYGKYQKKSELYIETHIADHCNLNCAYCSHYSPLVKEKFVDTVQYENDFKRLSELGADKVNFLRLMGGEPLLNDKLPALTRIARECFPKSRIQIVTNGVLLPKQGDEFWDVCSKYNIEISI